MKKYCKALSIALALFMVLNVLAPIKADAKKVVWKETEYAQYYLGPEYDAATGELVEAELELSSITKKEYDAKGNETKSTYTFYIRNYDTGERKKETQVTTYSYKKGKLYKVCKPSGNYEIYTWKKNNVSNIKEYTKNNSLSFETVYSYTSKGQLAKYVRKTKKEVIDEVSYSYDKKGLMKKYVYMHKGKLKCQRSYKNGIVSKEKSYTDDGKPDKTISYDKKGRPKMENGTCYDANGAKMYTYITTYKNTYVKDEISKIVAVNVRSDGIQDKREEIYYTSGVKKGRVKAYIWYTYDSETQTYRKSDESYFNYKADKNKNIVEETISDANGRITYKATHKYKKFTY